MKPGTAARGADVLLRIEDLRTHFVVDEGIVRAVDGVDLELRRGEVLGVVGESGCGKTIMSLSILRLVDAPEAVVTGAVRFDGVDLLQLTESALNGIRGSRIAMVFQQPTSSLDPVMPVGRQIGEVLRLHGGMGRRARATRAIELLERVGLADPGRCAREYAHQLSGGMAQRVMIAIALAGEPDLLIADEPTTALDVTVQAQILELLGELSSTLQMAVMLITHDLDVVAEIADRVAVMYAGQIVEEIAVSELYTRPLHPYTLGLMRSRPVLGESTARLNVIPGSVPISLDLPPGCRFAPRCGARIERGLTICGEVEPQPVAIRDDHSVRCWLYE